MAQLAKEDNLAIFHRWVVLITKKPCKLYINTIVNRYKSLTKEERAEQKQLFYDTLKLCQEAAAFDVKSNRFRGEYAGVHYGTLLK